MQYQSSKGPVAIDTMPISYAKNALNKLRRNEPERTAEIDALNAHVEKLTAETTAGHDAAADENPRAVIGGNNPPEEAPPPKLTGRAAIDAHVADLLEEAGNWADGVPLATQGQADDCARLLRNLQQAATAVDDAATDEKRPLNDQINAIGAWQNGYTAKGLKRTPDGSLTKAIAATGRLSAAWLQKQDDERREREAQAAAAALKAAQELVVVNEEAKATTDIAMLDRRDDALAEATALLNAAKGVAKEKVRTSAGEGVRGLTLRSVWRAESTGEDGCWKAALGHYGRNPACVDELRALIQSWADRDARSEAARGAGVPGFVFVEERVV